MSEPNNPVLCDPSTPITRFLKKSGRSFLATLLLVFALLPGAALADFTNGGFEANSFTGWTKTYLQNNGVPTYLLATPRDPVSIAELNLAAGATDLSMIVTGVTPESVDDVLMAGGTPTPSLKIPKYGSYSARVNLGVNDIARTQVLTTNGHTYTSRTRHAESIKQSVTVTAADVDPSDGKVHVRFTVAPVLDNPGHPADQQPYFAVELRKTASGGVPITAQKLFFMFNFAGQTTVWKATNTTSGGARTYSFTDWQAFDIAPGNAFIQVGDTVELEVIAAGCSLGGHEGHIYVDAVGFGLPTGLWVSAAGPAQTSVGQDITYTYTYSNNGSTSVNNVIVDANMPRDSSGVPVSLTYVSFNAPGGTCTVPAVGSTGTVSCNFGTMAPGTSGTFQVTVHVPAVVTGPLNNSNYPIRGDGVSALLGPLVQTVIVPAATLSDMSVNASGLPLTAAVGSAYVGSYTCANLGVAAATSATCDAANLPPGISVTGCTISPANAVWTQPAAVPAGQTVTCSVAGTASSAGTVSVVVTTGAGNDPNTANNTASRSVLVSNPPVPVADASSSVAGSAGSFNVAANDTKPLGSTYSQTATTCTPAGSMSSAGLASYTAPSLIGATCTVTYQVCNPAPDSATCASSTLTVTATAPSLSALPEATSTATATPGSFDVSLNDTKPAGSTYSQTATTCTPAGSMSSAGLASYTAPNVAGATCTVSYSVCLSAPNASTCTSSTLTVTASAVPPVPVADASSSVAGSAGSFNVAANDTKPLGSTYSQTATTCTPAGSMSSAGLASYTAPSLIGATCTVTYQVCNPAPDSATCASSTLTVTATAPSLSALPEATSTATATPGSFDVSLNDTKPAGSTYSQTATTCTPAGSMSSAGLASYTAPNVAGATCTVSYSVCLSAPNASTCTSSTLTVTASAVPPVPVADASSSVAGSAGSFNVAANDTKPLGSTYSQTATTCTPAGSMSSAGLASYTAPRVPGTSCTVSYQVCNPAPDSATCASAILTITVPAAIPTLSEWGLIVLSVLMGLFGAGQVLRRKNGL